MERKRRVTVYLDSKLVELAHIEIENMSKVINDFLEQYLSANGLETINKKIEETETRLTALKNRKSDMLKKGMQEKRKDSMNANVFNDLLQVYFKRRKQQGVNQYADELWITSPKNIKKTKILGKEPLEVLAELQNAYDSKKQKK